MDEHGKYPVYFECPDLLPSHERKVERYFRNRRKSGGGDGAGPLRKDDKGVYSVVFKHKKDQHEVLRKKTHVVEVGDASLKFTVREESLQTNVKQGSPESDRSKTDCATTTTNTGSSLPPSGERLELQVDSYILHYLKDCPKAGNLLQKQFALLYCTVELCPEDERVVMKRCSTGTNSDKTSADDWTTQLYALFETVKSRYTCHFETDPQKVKSLLESRSSQTEDDVKVYSDNGLAVVVGEIAQVKTRLNSLQEKSNSKANRIAWSLGKAKLRLLWDLLEHSLEEKFPKVKLSHEEGDKLVLEGNAAELLQADEYVAELDSQVIKRTLSDFSPRFLGFWEKAFAKPGIVDDFARLGVEIERSATDLQLFSFSSTSLDDVEHTLRTKFKLEEIPFTNAEVVYSLREKVRPTVRKINCDTCRVQVLASSDNKIYLVGHAEEVEELYEIVTQILAEDSEEKTRSEELAGRSLQSSHSFDLHEISSPASNPSYLSLQDLHSAHAKVDEQMSSLRLDQHAEVLATYFLNDKLEVLVCLGDITKQEADVLVNAASEDLKHIGGVALALSKAGGPEVQNESDALVENYGKIRTGEAVVTSGGELKCKKLIHAVGPVNGNASGRERALIQKAITSALGLCEMMDFTSIALPCVSSGVSGVPVDSCAGAIVSAVQAFGAVEGRSLKKITLIDNRKEVVLSMKEACDRLLRDMPVGGNSPDIEEVWSVKEQTGPEGSAEQMEAVPKQDTGGSVRVDVIQGTIETQQVDAVVSPMCGGNPRSTRIGNCLYDTVGPQLTDSFSKQNGGEIPGDSVLVEGLTEAPFKAVFFVHLLQWDYDPSGTAIQVLRLVVSDVLSSCEKQGFNSIAFPVLGAGVALRFPDDIVAQVLLEEIHNFDQRRTSSSPFTVNIVCPSNDHMLETTFNSIQTSLEHPVAKGVSDSESKRIILLGKTGSGKSSLGNTILGEDFFKADDSPNSGTKTCQSQTRTIDGKNITLIDTPGLFDSERPEEELMPEILSCLTESAPGPHAFLIVLKVEKFTAQEQAIFTKICQYFSEEALQYATVVFTHGNQLPPGTTIETFVKQNKRLSELVRKCGNRCHVFDNTYWNDKQPDKYRNNQIQVEALLETIDQMVKGNDWGFYSNKAFRAMEEDIQKEMEMVKTESDIFVQSEDLRKEAKKRVSDRWLISLAGMGTGALLGAIFGIEALVKMVMMAVQKTVLVKGARKFTAAIGFGATASEMAVVAGAGIGAAGLAGGIYGGVIGGRAADDADSVEEACERAKKAVICIRENSLKSLDDLKKLC